MATKTTVYKVRGILKASEESEGTGPNGDWSKASLVIEKEDGSKTYVATFNEDAIEIARKAVNKEVEVKYVKKGKYKNLYGHKKSPAKNSIKIVGDGEAPIEDEEPIEDGESEEVEGEETDETEETEEEVVEEPSSKKNVTPSEYKSKDDYWTNKFEWEKKTNEEKQLSIVRQNSWTQALHYLDAMLKAKELGILKGDEDLTAKDITVEKIKGIAHTIEEDINRKKQ